MHEILQQDKFRDANFKYDNIFFQIPVQKYPSKTFLVKNTIKAFLFKTFFDPNFGIFYFREILQLDKFEAADLKHDNIVFKFQPKKTQIRHFWSQICAFLFLRKKLQLNKFENASFKYDNSFLKKFWPQNTQMWHF